MPRRYLHNLGDVNPIERGGGYVIRRSVKGAPPSVFLEYVEWDGEEDDAKGSLYKVRIPKSGEVWAWMSWVSPARRADLSRQYDTDKVADNFIKGVGNVAFRARILEDVASYYSWVNLDSYPLRVTRADLKKRWRTWGRRR